jgi:hypothetical protein
MNGWMSQFWVTYPFFLPREAPQCSSITTFFLANNIHDQLFKFPTEGMFWYSSVLAYMFLFYQADKFLFPMQKLDQDGKPQPVTFWTSLLRRNSTEFSFKQFIEQFYHPVVSMLSGRQEQRINEEIQRILHLSDLAKMGDWYLYQNHTEIRVYGCELAPYKLPKYLPVRIFALEYIRKMINSDDIHFVSLKKKQQLRIKGKIGSFICNSRAVGEEANKLLKEMKFHISSPWHYDPCGIIAEMRFKNKSSPYAHVPKPEIEKYMNQTEWEANTLEDTEPQLLQLSSHKPLHHRYPRRKDSGRMSHLQSLKCHRKSSRFTQKGPRSVTQLPGLERKRPSLPQWSREIIHHFSPTTSRSYLLLHLRSRLTPH